MDVDARWRRRKAGAQHPRFRLWKSQFFLRASGVFGGVADLDRRSHTRICYCAVLLSGPFDVAVGRRPRRLLKAPKRYEAHIQATESEACEQAWFPGTHEDSRREKNPCEAAGPGTRPPRGEDRLEIIEWRQPVRLRGRAREEEDSACLARGGSIRRETFDPFSGMDRGRRRPVWTSSFCLHPGQATVGA